MSTLLEEPHEVALTIYRRRTARAYTAKRPDDDMMRGTLDAAVQASHARHAEPWAFVICRKRPGAFTEADCWLGPKI